MALTDLLGIEVVSANDDRVEAVMSVTPDLYQDHGFLHGGATISLLETAASVGAEHRTDFSCELPFGIDVHVRHRKSGKQGTLRGIAELDREESSRAGGRKQFWNVSAVDEEGDVVSEGVVVTKIVSLERLAEKERERAALRSESA